MTPLRSDYDRPETIEETAELVTSLGGEGIAVAVDHLDPAQVEAFATRVRDEQGRLDVLVNDIWGAELLKGGPAQWDTPIWELDLEDGLRILRLAVDTHVITSRHLLPLLVERPGGLVVEVTDGTTDYNADEYRISVYYDLAKVSVNRLAFSQGHELARVDGTAVAITPGFLRSEMMLEAFGVREENCASSPVRPTSRCRSRPGTSVVRSPRSPPIPSAPGGTSGRSRRASSPRPTASPTSTARNPRSGATSPTPEVATPRPGP